MLEKEFKKWLVKEGVTKPKNYILKIKDVEEYLGDIDEHYDNDRCESLLDLFNYTKEDQRYRRYPKHNLPIDKGEGKEKYEYMYEVTRDLKIRLNRYVEFRDSLNLFQKVEIRDIDYREIAMDEYFKFKNTRTYDEEYKKEALEDLNKYFAELKKIDQSNILDIIENLKEKNPAKGSLTHWTTIDTFRKYAEDRPEEVAGKLRELLDEERPLSQRIKSFLDISDDYKADFARRNESSLTLGSSLIAYILAAYNMEKYPIYKMTNHNVFMDHFELSSHGTSIEDRYTSYYELIRDIVDYMEEEDFKEDANVYDGQDFLYCITSYEELKVNIAVRYLHELSQVLKSLSLSDKKFIDYINNMDKDRLTKLKINYRDSEKVNGVREKVADHVLAGNKLSLEVLEEIKAKEGEKFESNIFIPWNNYKILFPFYNLDIDDRVQKSLDLIIDAVRSHKELGKYKNERVVGFGGMQNFGDVSCFFALYTDEYRNHREADQLYMSIGYKDEELSPISYGLFYGQSRSDAFQDDLDTIEFEEFKYRDLIDKYKSIDERISSQTIKSLDDYEEIFRIEDLKVDFNREINLEGLYFEDEKTLKQQISLALKSQKNIIFIGPPGTGKSKIARQVAKSYRVDHKMVTALSDWSVYETIGGYRPKKDGTLEFYEGIFLEALKYKNNNPKNKWVIVDEINRSDIDKSFGPLFSALSGDDVDLGLRSNLGREISLVAEKNLKEIAFNEYQYIIPNDWRILGTMNTYDKTSLYEMSYAFMRRFAFIPIGIPRNINGELISKYYNIWELKGDEILYRNMSVLWNTINRYREIGPAIIEDMARFIALGGDYTSAVIMYVLPQLEGLFDDEIIRFTKELISLDNIIVESQKLLHFIEDFFSLSLGSEII